jgi:hypothetical protein
LRAGLDALRQHFEKFDRISPVRDFPVIVAGVPAGGPIP